MRDLVKKYTVCVLTAAITLITTTAITPADNQLEIPSVKQQEQQEPQPTQTIVQPPEKLDIIATADPLSVSEIKLCIDTPIDVLSINCQPVNDSRYTENITIRQQSPNIYYITGLRENTGYAINIKPCAIETYNPLTLIISTLDVDVSETFHIEPDETGYFAYETAAGLTLDPSKSAISDAFVDDITNTGIMRNDNGDYCVAMGLYFGQCNDRFLVTLVNGVQFTVKICDSKGKADDGNGKYHCFGENGKCFIEFIHSPDALPEDILLSGNYATQDFDGLKLDEIAMIQKIA